jgi:trehalose synthase
MFQIAFCLASLSFSPDTDLVQESMLYRADQLSKKYALELAMTPPPLTSPQPEAGLQIASSWLAIDVPSVATADGKTALQVLGENSYLEALRLLGVQGLYLTGLKKGGTDQISLHIDPQLGSQKDWDVLSERAMKKGLSLVGESLGAATGLGADFQLALQNVQDYPNLYHLIEIDPSDWQLLPPIPQGDFFANVPWLTLQDLHKKGYVPEQFDAYKKQTNWNCTTKILGQDGKSRRWIYLKKEKNSPVVDWLGSSFAAMRLTAADALHAVYELGQQGIAFSAEMPANARDTLALWTRKLGAFSVQETVGGFTALDGVSADFVVDTLTRPALLHALIAEDAEILRLTYRLFLEQGIDTKRLVHMLQPFDRFACDWSLWLNSPDKVYRYYEEQVTAAALKRLLLKEDLVRLGQPVGEKLPLSTWAGYCMSALNIEDFEEQQEKISAAHLLLAFFYGMQPGIFSVSLSDLLGALPNSQGPLNLFGPNESTLYPSLPLQLKNSRSFATGLNQILTVRKDRGLPHAELISVLPTPHRGTLLLLYRQKGTQFLQLLAMNFSRTPVQEALELPQLRQTTAIDLLTSLAETKPIDSAYYLCNLPPLSGKIILFQPKYYP